MLMHGLLAVVIASNFVLILSAKYYGTHLLV